MLLATSERSEAISRGLSVETITATESLIYIPTVVMQAGLFVPIQLDFHGNLQPMKMGKYYIPNDPISTNFPPKSIQINPEKTPQSQPILKPTTQTPFIMKINQNNKQRIENPTHRQGSLFFAICISIFSMFFSSTETNAQILTKLTTISPVNWQGSGSMYPPFRNGETIRFKAKLEYQSPSRVWIPLSGRRVNLVFNPRAVDLRFSPMPPFSKTTDSSGYVTWDIRINDVKLNNRRGSISVLPAFEFKDPNYIYRESRSLANLQLYKN